MPKHNYSQYSSNNKKKNPNQYKAAYAAPTIPTAEHAAKPAVEPVEKHIEKPVVETVVKPVVETVETVAMPTTVSGTVANCAKLNVRSAPSVDSEIVCVLDVMSEIEIDVEKSTNEWLKICTAIGIEGYCMRRFVDAYL